MFKKLIFCIAWQKLYSAFLGKMAKFLADLHSGKLHREYHYGPEPDSQG